MPVRALFQKHNKWTKDLRQGTTKEIIESINKWEKSINKFIRRVQELVL